MFVFYILQTSNVTLYEAPGIIFRAQIWTVHWPKDETLFWSLMNLQMIYWAMK